MTVLVTGGAGYIGSHMVHGLIDAGEQVVVLDNLTTGFDWAVAPGAELVVGDAGNQAGVAALIAAHRVDAVIHFAASIVVPDSVRDPLGYYSNNTVNSRALIETAVKAGLRHFIFSSTAAVYGNPPACASSRRQSYRADLALRLLEADDRNHAARRGEG
jgi:UDP-glucose 4-epimerase